MPVLHRLAVLLAVVAATLVAAAPVDAAPPHRLPVDGVVTRRFDLPTAPWAAGHRGVDLAASPGRHVRASAAGEVAFAGSVAGAAWVTIDHGGDLRTSYGPLATTAVRAGDLVGGGTVLGTVAASEHHAGLHWSARRGGEYVDPLDLVAAILVASLEGPGRWWPTGHHDLPTYDPWDGRDTTFGLLPATARAEAPGWLAPPTPNHVIGVPGLMTQTGSTPLPLDFLGYEPEAITILGHAGRDQAVGDPADPWRDQLPHEKRDTLEGVHRSALLLADQLRAQWAREPGVAVDLVGHSMGGVVVLHYLLAVHDPADPTLPPIANAVTLSAPLEGADGADAGARLLDGWSATRYAVEVAAGVLGIRLHGGTIDDLAVGSPLLRELAASWAEAQADPHRSPLASGTRVLTVGGATDVIVPEHRSDLPGADHVVVPGGHTAMHESEATLQVVRAFLEDRPVPAGEGSWGAWTSPLVSAVQQLAGFVDVP